MFAKLSTYTHFVIDKKIFFKCGATAEVFNVYPQIFH